LFLCMLTDLNAFRCVNAVTWSPDGKSLASASDDESVMIWCRYRWTNKVDV